jgi:hypothetical protein
MNIAKGIALYVCGALMVVICAVLVDALAVLGSPAYAVEYPAARLCSSLQPGMELRDAEARVFRLGRPGWIEYRSRHLTVGSMDSGCILDLDPATSRIVKITISGGIHI